MESEPVPEPPPAPCVEERLEALTKAIEDIEWRLATLERILHVAPSQ